MEPTNLGVIMPAQWEYSGVVNISRLGEREGETMELPFTFYSPYPGAPLTPREIDNRAEQIGRDFLAMLADTMPSHRADYGGIVSVDVTLMHIVNR
jgi:hypothetical protein